MAKDPFGVLTLVGSLKVRSPVELEPMKGRLRHEFPFD